MKVRVLREMPFAKVGEVLNINNDMALDIKGFIGGYTEICIKVGSMIQDGWLEEVKEERLEDKLMCHIKLVPENVRERVAKIAHDHYLEVFDKASENVMGFDCLKRIRTALEQA